MKHLNKILGLFGSILATLLFAFLMGSCSDSASDTPTTADTTAAVSSLTQVPSLDLSIADSSASALQLSPVQGITLNDEEGDASELGCYCLDFFKPQAISSSKMAQIPLCYISKTQASDPDTFVIPSDGTYAYYSFGNTLLRVGNFTEGRTTTLKGDVCDPIDGVDTQRMSFDMIKNTTALSWTLNVIDHFNEVDEDGEADDVLTFNSFSSVITMNSLAAMDADFAFANVSNLSSTGYRGENASTANVESGTSYDFSMRMLFEYAKATANNHITASMFQPDDDGDISGVMDCLFDAVDGGCSHGDDFRRQFIYR